MLIHLLIIIKNNLRANLLLMAGMFVIATSLWYAVDYVYAVVCLLYTSPSPRDMRRSRMPSSA